MALIEWSREMSVGIMELDEDHQVLIGIINDLAELQGAEASAQALRATFEHLKHYAEFHFAREEAVMRSASYPVLSDHQVEHRDFESRMRDLSRRLERDPNRSALEINYELLHYLKNWLQHHILVIDKDYRPHVEGNLQAERTAKEFKASHHWWS